jgi:hypothetical protein
MQPPEFSIQTSLGITLCRCLNEADVVAIPDVISKDMNNGYIWYYLPIIEVNTLNLTFSLCFHNTKLNSINFSIYNPELYGYGWNDWSEEKQKTRAEHTAQWLSDIGYSTGSFDWGEIWVGLDVKSGWGHGVVRYTSNGSINSDWLTVRAISAFSKSSVGRLLRQHRSGIASRLSRTR